MVLDRTRIPGLYHVEGSIRMKQPLGDGANRIHHPTLLMGLLRNLAPRVPERIQSGSFALNFEFADGPRDLHQNFDAMT